MSRKANNRRPKNRPDEEWITTVKPADVLFGRGSGPNDHEGNIRFRKLVAERKPDYLATTHRQTKAGIAREIVNVVWNEGGRFLKRLDGGVDAWCVVDEETTLEKAKQALRQNREKAPSTPSPVSKVASITNEHPVPPKATITPEVSGNVMPAPPPRSAAPKETAPKETMKEMANGDFPSSSLLSVGGFSATGEASMSDVPTNDSLGMDPYEPIPVGVMSERQSMTSGLEVWADFAAQQQASQEISYVAPAEPGGSLEREGTEKRRESLQISDLVGVEQPESSAEMDDVTAGLLRLSTQTMDDEVDVGSSATLDLDQRPDHASHTSRGLSSGANSKASNTSNLSNMSGVSVESDSLLAAAKLVTGPLPTSPLINDNSSQASDEVGGEGAQKRPAKQGPADASIQLADVWRRESLLNRPLGGVIQEEDPDETGQTALPRRVSVMAKDPDNMSYLGSSSFSVLKAAMVNSGDSTMTFSKGQLSEMLDEGEKG